jgi:hypothetical protein
MITLPTCREKSGERSYNRVNRHSVFPYTAKYTISMSEDWLKPREKKSYTQALAEYVASYIPDAWGEPALEYEDMYRSGTAKPLEFPITTQAEEDWVEAEVQLSAAKRALHRQERRRALEGSPEMAAYEARRAESERRFAEMGMDVSSDLPWDREAEIIDSAKLAAGEQRLENLRGNMAAVGVPETRYDFIPTNVTDQDSYWKEEISIEEGWPYAVVHDAQRRQSHELATGDPQSDPRLIRQASDADPASDAGFMLQQRLLGLNPSAVQGWRADNRNTFHQSPFRPAPLVDESAGHGAGLQPVPPVSGYEVPEFLMLPPER